MNDRVTHYVGSDTEIDNFYFVCEGCHSEGELGVPRDTGMQPFGCPEACGAVYVRWRKPNGRLALKCVVCPIFEDGDLVEVPVE